jgi:hypothetical protein
MRFGRLTILERAGTRPLKWLCRCDCGTEKVLPNTSIAGGSTKSCGCLFREKNAEKLTAFRKSSRPHNFTHGLSEAAEFSIWHDMISRCENKNTRAYKYYGARGISVCAEWRQSFWAFYHDMGPRPSPHLSIDRINNDGNYEPGNCRWATAKVQANNKRRRCAP